MTEDEETLLRIKELYDDPNWGWEELAEKTDEIISAWWYGRTVASTVVTDADRRAIEFIKGRREKRG